jgi:hypothetical protein
MGLVDQRAFVYLGKNCRSSVQMGHTCGFCPGLNWTPQISHMRASSAPPSIELSPGPVLNPQHLAASWSSFSTSTHKWNSHSKSLCNPVSFWNKNCQMHNTKTWSPVSSSQGWGGGSYFLFFFLVFNVFSSCSLEVPKLFSRRSQKHLNFIPYGLPKVQLSYI